MEYAAFVGNLVFENKMTRTTSPSVAIPSPPCESTKPNQNQEEKKAVTAAEVVRCLQKLGYAAFVRNPILSAKYLAPPPCKNKRNRNQNQEEGKVRTAAEVP